MKVKTFYAALAVLAIALGSVTTAMADDITAQQSQPQTANTISKTGVLSWKAAFIMLRIRKH